MKWRKCYDLFKSMSVTDAHTRHLGREVERLEIRAEAVYEKDDDVLPSGNKQRTEQRKEV